MSDYIPNPPNPERDPRNYDRYYEDNSGKGVTLVVGIRWRSRLAAGLMFFAGSPSERTDQAQLPAQERTMNPPAKPAIPCDAAGGSGPSGCQSAAVRPPRSWTKKGPAARTRGRAAAGLLCTTAS